jgi:peptide/nickel transport system ATP-binding protein
MADGLLVQSLSVRFPGSHGAIHALDGIDFAVPPGCALGLVGESGSGKSTAILALLGLLGGAAVQAKTMDFAGNDLLTQAPALRGRRIAAVFQDPSSTLNPALSIGAQVAEPLLVHARLPRAEALAQAAALLAETGLPRPGALMTAYPHQLSGGMKQRVAIAMALAGRPDLLLLDEPTTALDVTVEAGILDLLDGLRRSRGLSLLLVSHNLGIVERLCDRVTVLYAGRVTETGPVDDVLGRTRHPYARGLLAALPRLGDRRPLAPIQGSLPDLARPDPGCNFRPRCPFAAPGCEAPQALHGDQHQVSCHRWRDAALLPWPAPPPGAAPPPPTTMLIQTDAIACSFGPVRAVDGVSIGIRRGEVLGLVGESGCGKSTLGRLLLRLVDADSGTLAFDGAPVPPSPPLAFRRQAQIVFQNPDTALNPRHTVAAILRRPLHRFGLARGQAAESIETLLDLVRLPRAYADRYPHQLSGGEKQRVGIARALASQPSFIVCDEAVSALDVSVQAAILNLLADLRARLGLALLFISHDIGVIAHLSDRIAVMYGGRIMEEGPAAAVLAPPHHPYTAALLSAVPVIGARTPRQPLQGDSGAVHPGPSCRFAQRCPVRLGPICDTIDPPWQTSPEGHRIRCHIPLPAPSPSGRVPG